ncbi:MAG: DNA-processing protein DprA [Desulfobacterales bacterium]|nr:DNA-processing protein DprA [Desulfobacterales bacterium]MBS3755690.1 DNA-processing protein DprA [Desulfobacterales bacterium]
MALRQASGIGPLIYKRLIDRFGLPEKVLSASRADLLGVAGMTENAAQSVIRAGSAKGPQEEIACCRENGYRIITLQDAQYPYRLARIADPPPYLYAFGEDIPAGPAVAIVGTRNCTRYGISMARRLSADLAAMGMVIVSGMARGVDSGAHRGALEAGGKTVAVLGSGLSVIYPSENRGLYFDIAKNGTVISELPVKEIPNSYNFPARNRIISGMSLGTVVVEAAKKSGSLITARLAAEQGREVFAVPGNIQSYKSTGTHALLKQGARLVERAEDVIEELAPLLVAGFDSREETSPAARETEKAAADLTAEEKRIYDALDSYPAHIDELAQCLKTDVGSLLAELLKLELKGMAVQMPGKYFCRSGV